MHVRAATNLETLARGGHTRTDDIDAKPTRPSAASALKKGDIIAVNNYIEQVTDIQNNVPHPDIPGWTTYIYLASDTEPTYMKPDQLVLTYN